MRIREKERVKNKFKTHNFIFIYVITTIVAATLSLSRYSTTTSKDNTAKVALMANSAIINVDVPIESSPGESSISEITVSNSEEGKICEVAQEFSMIVEREAEKNLPVVYSLYTDPECTAESEIAKDADGNFISEQFKLKAGELDEKVYYLKVDWPAEENDEELAFEIGYFSIDIKASQID